MTTSGTLAEFAWTALLTACTNWSWTFVISSAIVLWTSYVLVHELLVSPLAKYPGPKLWALSNLPSQISLMRGHHHLKMLALHNHYGPIVRTGPTTLSFNTAKGFRDIYGFRPGVPQFPKDPKVYGSSLMPTRDAVGGFLSNEAHSRQRRLLAHGFSDRSIRDLEPRIIIFMDLFISRLRDQARQHKNVNIKAWLEFAAFDITGDLMFGETFDCLRDSQLHPWIEFIFSSIMGTTILSAIRHFPILAMLQEICTPSWFRQQLMQNFKLSAEKAERRIAQGIARADFMSAMLKNGIADASSSPQSMLGEKPIIQMSRHEIHANSTFIILAGSETTATALSGCIYYLCTNPSALKRLIDDVREEFSNDVEITNAKCANLPFVDAVIDEGLRLYSPMAAHLPRVVPSGGATVAGNFLPEDTNVHVPHYASYMSESNFFRAKEFLPERWLQSDPQFEADQRDTLQPFSLGARNCLGKSLAYLEMRLTIVKLVFNFDLELCPESKKWSDQHSYFIWHKPALMVRLIDRFAE
ncbi:sterigmatocystin biosynthesis P450 monooxygenase stcL [Penicillium macrosclerotiorum]|uniref:sterigmatocystin biosynthesis P450 monooxygenase stcL n=1 Tax=Penicillium macrosclerotiorum TaxID=303699 RepID=UPI002549BD19|nr:sterigmatocystin biosynthesis P450 monooxygenase stcL [Penicillium macrosclerotiorum]KAJ5683044.1 sterigmatocystin biosynthesis P450 monooxygenase stcL [Penicillium macrosclerotiorum]